MNKAFGVVVVVTLLSGCARDAVASLNAEQNLDRITKSTWWNKTPTRESIGRIADEICKAEQDDAVWIERSGEVSISKTYVFGHRVRDTNANSITVRPGETHCSKARALALLREEIEKAEKESDRLPKSPPRF